MGILPGDFCPGEWTVVVTLFINGTGFEATNSFIQTTGGTSPVVATWTNLRTVDLTSGTIAQVRSVQIDGQY